MHDSAPIVAQPASRACGRSPDHVVLGIRPIEVRLAQREVRADLVILRMHSTLRSCHMRLTHPPSH